MSAPQNITVACPKCSQQITVSKLGSVNIDRNPEEKTKILDSTLEVHTCSSCQASFRLPPSFPCFYLNKSLWIAAHPKESRGDWKNIEAQSLDVFERALGPKASGPAKEIGEGVRARVTFGWSALREKILMADLNLSDIEIEMAKMLILKSNPEMGLSYEIRLVAIEENDLVFYAFHLETDEVKEECFQLNKSTLADIQENLEDWKEIRSMIDQGLWVDLLRTIL